MWTLNASAPKKNIVALVDQKREEYKGQNYMDGEVDLVPVIVKAVLDKFKPNDEQQVDVIVVKGETGGATAVNINVVIH